MSYLYNDQKLKIRRKQLRNNMPNPEQKLWYYLRNRNLKGYKFRRQFSIDNFILDFFCPELKLAIEVDGDSHFVDSAATLKDKRRDQFLGKRQIKLLRFTNDETINNIDAVIENILNNLS